MRSIVLHAMAIGSGGFLGAIARAGIGEFVTRYISYTYIPFGTLTVNLLGCSAIGLLTGLAESRQLSSPELRAFLLIGFLGGFTTFSTFAHETLVLLRQNEHMAATMNIGIHIGLGLLFAWAAYSFAASNFTPSIEHTRHIYD